MKKFYFLLLALTSVLSNYAQVASNYVFSQTNGTYVPITGGTVYGNTSSDDQAFLNPAEPLGTIVDDIGPGIAIGFNFTYNGEVFDRVAIDYNGWISFGKSSLSPSVDHSSSSYYNSLSSTLAVTPAALRNRIAVLSLDLVATPTAELRVQTIGTGTAQTLVVQWKDVRAFGSANASDLYNFQLRLQQTTNTVSIVYGSFTRTATTAVTAQVGLGGTTAADYNNRMTTTNWATSTAGTANTSSVTLNATVLPTAGLTFNWALASCLPPLLSSLQFTSTAIPNASISWSSVSGAASYEYAIGTAATPPASGANTTATTASATGLPPATVVYAHVRTNCGRGSFSNWVTRAYLPCVANIAPAANATNLASPINFSFNTLAGATSYRIFVSADGGVTYPLSATVPTSPVSLSGLDYSTTYRWFVRAIAGQDTAAVTCASNATSFTTIAESTTPPNNPCNAAVGLSINTPVTGTTIGATESVPSVVCAGFESESALDVWYTITARSNGTASIALTGAADTLDAVLVAYSGSCGALTPLNCADNTLSGGNETMNLTGLVAGQTYRIRVYGYDGSTGTFTITASGPALPVTGVTLNAIRNGGKTQLSWKTLTEVNNAGFELQRSADGKNFSGIASMASKASGGNSTAAITYNYDDARPLAGANYYRLKQTDKDGKTSYSNIVYLKGIAVSNLTVSAIYPNPTRDVLKASVQAPAAETIMFIVTDMMGKTISRQLTNITSGDNTVNINVANLPSGSYLLKAVCRNGCETAYQKFTKQ